MVVLRSVEAHSLGSNPGWVAKRLPWRLEAGLHLSLKMPTTKQVDVVWG